MDTQQVHSQDPVPVHAHCTEEVTRSNDGKERTGTGRSERGREGVNSDVMGVGSRSGDGISD